VDLAEKAEERKRRESNTPTYARGETGLGCTSVIRGRDYHKVVAKHKGGTQVKLWVDPVPISFVQSSVKKNNNSLEPK